MQLQATFACQPAREERDRSNQRAAKRDTLCDEQISELRIIQESLISSAGVAVRCTTLRSSTGLGSERPLWDSGDVKGIDTFLSCAVCKFLQALFWYYSIHMNRELVAMASHSFCTHTPVLSSHKECCNFCYSLMCEIELSRISSDSATLALTYRAAFSSDPVI